MAELNALLKYVDHWVSNAFIGKAQLNTKAISEMLLRRKLDILNRILDEYDLSFDIALVRFNQN